MGLYILLAVLAVLVIFICVLLIRAALAAKKAEPIGEKPVYTTEQEDIENGETADENDKMSDRIVPRNI